MKGTGLLGPETTVDVVHAAAAHADAAQAPEPPLPQRLREATQKLHVQAERSGMMAALLRGRVTRNDYCLLLRNLHAIYAELETGALAQLVEPALHRCDVLAQDLQHLHGALWREQLPLTEVTLAYVQRLQSLVRDASPALAAHAYVRYLGDLHGGQVLAGVVQRALVLAPAEDGRPAEGTRFYGFGDADEVLALRTRFRQRLTQLTADPAQQALITDEACWAFEQHARLFEQLQPAA